MTSEIVVMNKFGLAIAADSAVTISNGKIYNSANKIFNVNNNSIGIMFYGSGELMNIPLETIVSSYNSTVGSFDTLESCAQSFIDYLSIVLSTRTSEEIVHNYFKLYLLNFYNLVYAKIDNSAKEQNLQISISDPKFNPIADKVMQDLQIEIDAIDNISLSSDSEDFKDILKGFPKLNIELDTEAKQNNQNYINPFNTTQQGKIHELCFKTILKKWNYSLSTGVVVTGYGTKDIFPKIKSYSVFGYFNKNLIYYSTDIKDIDEIQNIVSINPFAQCEMTSTFMQGIHPNIKSYQETYWDKILTKLSASICKNLSEQIKGNESVVSNKLNEMFAKIYTDYVSEMDNIIMHFNTMDILNVCGSLPVDELGLMAETLVNINSFRKKLSQEPQTIGGPIDVAIISKKDGFIWLNKKDIKQKKQ